MKNEIHFYCENDQKTYHTEKGVSLIEASKKVNLKLQHKPLGAFINNSLHEMSYELYKPKNVSFIDISHTDGMRMYTRSLQFVLIKACETLYPNRTVHIQHSISKGIYCEFEGVENSSFDTVLEIANKMREIIAADIPFRREEIPTEEAIKLFKEKGETDKVKLLSTRKTPYSSIYTLAETHGYFYGFMVPSTGYLAVFDLVKYYNGMLLVRPQKENPAKLQYYLEQDKLFEIFQEHKNWANILGLSGIGALNERTIHNDSSELIKISEALHEKKVAQLADRIASDKNTKFILIAGPSSSGKTTFSMRLGVQLKVLGKAPIQISLDNYFVNRNDTPKDEKGEFNFEDPMAIDIELFNQHLLQLLQGKSVEIPKFSFETGMRYYDGTTLQAAPNTYFVIEGIHALNPLLTQQIDAQNMFKIYISALTQLSIDKHNRIPTTDNRLLRRIVRDYQYRSYSAQDTLNRWKSVRAGEEKYIFPYQEEADVMFNSALLYELGVLKPFAEPILREVPKTERSYAEAKRLLKFLSYFKEIPIDEIPPTSIIREFLVGSTFNY